MLVTNLGTPIQSKKMSLCYQFTTGGKEYLMALYLKYNTDPCDYIFAIWNLTDDTRGLINITGANEGECYPVCFCSDLLSNGHFAIVNRGYYIEIDPLTRTQVATHVLGELAVYPGDAGLVEGTTGHIIIAEGTNHANMWIEWCDKGGGNWDGKQLTIPVDDMYIARGGIGSMTASDGHNYAYAAQYNRNCVIAVRMDTKAESKLTFPGSPTVVSIFQLTGGRIVANASGGSLPGWYAIDGLNVSPTSAPNANEYFHKVYISDNYQYERWFTSQNITVTKTKIMPTDAGVVSINVGDVDKDLSPVALYGINISRFSSPNPSGDCLVQAGDYGPNHRFHKDDASFHFLGYPHRNTYHDRWSASASVWDRIGYDKCVETYDPAQAWTSGFFVGDPTAVNPAYHIPGISIPGDHFLWPVNDANDGWLYFSAVAENLINWWNRSSTWGQLSLQTALGLYEVHITCMKAVSNGAYIAISSRDKDTSGSSYVGRIHLFEVSSKTIVKSITLTGAVDGGSMCAVGTTDHVIVVSGNTSPTSQAWRIDTSASPGNEVIWHQNIAGNVFNHGTSGMDTQNVNFIDIAINGLIYLYIDLDIYTLDPANGNTSLFLTHSATIPGYGRIALVDSNLYIYATNDNNLYKISDFMFAYSYSRGNYSVLPNNDDDLKTIYSTDDINKVLATDGLTVSQTAQGGFSVHQLKILIAKSTTTVTASGPTNIPCSSWPVYLQIYRRLGAGAPVWETIAIYNNNEYSYSFSVPLGAVGNVVPDLTNYKTTDGWISFRLYQYSG